MSKRGKSGRSPRQGRLPFPYLTVAFFGYLALYFFVVVADLSYWNHRFDLGPTLRAAGTITRLEKDGGRSVTYKTDYIYTDETGRPQNGVVEIDQVTWNSLRVGDSIPVECLAGEPGRSRYGQWRSWVFPTAMGLISAVMAACIGISRKVNLPKHIQLGLPKAAEPPSHPEQVFRATLDQHWPFSLIIEGLGFGLLFAVTLGTDEPFDTGMIGQIAMFPVALFLVVLPVFFHFRFYVRLTDDHFEIRGFGGPQKIAWRELTDVWQYQIPQTAFACPDRSFDVNFKLFPQECYARVRERIEAWFGKAAR